MPSRVELLLIAMFLAFGAGLLSRLMSSRSNSGAGSWLARLGLILVGMLFFGFLSIRVTHRPQMPMEVVAPMPLINHSESVISRPPVAPTPPYPSAAGDSIEEMWRQLTAPRIKLEEVAETATADAPRVGPSSPQELSNAAKVILSASLPGADPFTQGWLVNAAKSILGMPVSEQDQVELRQAATEALAMQKQSIDAAGEVATSASMQSENGAAPVALSAEALSVGTVVEPRVDRVQPVITEAIAALPKPDWVVNPPKQIGNVRKFVVTSDPYLTADECRQDADNKMQSLALARAAELSGIEMRRWGAASLADLGLGGDYVRRELCTDEYVDVFDSSVGQMRKTYSLLEFNEAQDALLVDRARCYSRQEGLLGVALIGSGVLGSVATLFGLLKIDTWTRGYYTKRLFLGVPAAIITGLTMLFLS